MSLGELVALLRRAGVRLSVDERGLRWTAPDGAFPPELRAEVLRHREELTALVREAQVRVGGRAPAAPAAGPQGGQPLTGNQQRWLQLSRRHAELPAAHVAVALRLHGPLDQDRLERALADVGRRNDALRSTVRWVDDQPVQAVRCDLPDEQLLRCRGGLREEELATAVEAEARRPLVLEHGPLWRATLLGLDVDDHALVLTAHHAFTDGWSAGLLVADLLAAYGGTAPATDPGPVPVPSAADHRAATLPTRAGAAGLLHVPLGRFQAAAAGSLPAPPGSDAAAFATTRLTTDVAAPLTAVLRDVARRHGCTLFVTLLTAFLHALGRAVQRSALVVGVPVANRTCPESERRIGLFADTLPVHVDLAGADSPRERLTVVREAFLGAHDRDRVPFADLERSLGYGPSLGRAPLVRVLMAYQDAPWPTLRVPGLRLTRIDLDTGAAAAELCLSVTERDGGLRGTLDRSAALDERTAEQVLGGWSAGLTELAALSAAGGRGERSPVDAGSTA